MNDANDTIICVPFSQHFRELSIAGRGLYVTFLAQPDEINSAQKYYRVFTPQVVFSVVGALLADELFCAEKGSRPIRYVRVRKPKPKNDDLPERLLAIYQELRDPAWVNHRILSRTLRKSLKAFAAQVGEAEAESVMRRGLSAQKEDWAAGKPLDFLNLLTNDKVIRFAERRESEKDTSDLSGQVYRLNTGSPDPTLPRRASYAIRVDEQTEDSVTGFAFPEGEPNLGVKTTVHRKNLAAAIGDWARYSQQHA